MQYKFLALLLIFSNCCFAQKKLKVIKAASRDAVLYEEGQRPVKWTLSPETQTDVYVTDKLTRPTKVRLKTDIDSICITLKPGQQKDFIVLLNGTDSCLTRFQSPEVNDYNRLVPEIHDTMPLVINSYNTIYVKAVVNGTDTLDLNFDTGASELSLLEDVLQHKIKSSIKLYDTYHDVQIGKRIYKTKIYDTKLAGHGTEGRFGWDLLDGMVVELNYDKRIMVVHSKLPKAVKKDKSAAKLNIRYFNKRFFTEAEIVQGGTVVKDWFLFDTGYERTVMLDNDLLKEENFPTSEMRVLSKTVMHGATGKEVPVITSDLQSLKIGKYRLDNVPAQVMTTSKTLFGSNIHILGNEVLKRFNAYLDFQDNVVYLVPNHWYRSGYTEKI